MIAAVLGPRSSPAVAARLRDLATAAGIAADDARTLLAPGAGLLAAVNAPQAGLDERRRAVWLGSIRPCPPNICLPEPALSGRFSAAALSDTGDLLLARSRFGGHSLFYALDRPRGVWLVCSRLEPLVAVLGDAALDVDRLAAAVLGSTPRDHALTWYRAVRRVPSATVLRLSMEGVGAQHAMSFGAAPRRSDAIERIANELRERIETAVARRVVESQNVAVSVSGGVDSSVLLALTLSAARRL